MGTAAEVEASFHSPTCEEEKIVVSVRLRPLNEKEIARNDVSDWECVDQHTVLYKNCVSVSERSMYPSAYNFDHVFGPQCPTRQVYEEGAKEVVLSVVSGINSSVFAYGQTSSGKTYTMGGITEYTVADIFDYIETHNEREFVLKLSAMEIYNESVRDLLSSDSTPLRLLDDPERGTVVEKLTEETVSDWNHFKDLLSVCEAQRQIGETNLNEASSRSHQILRLIVESSKREFMGYERSSILAASVNFVDLAGSERASQSLSAGTRLKEGCHINRSLLTLGTVIRKLSKGRNSHIPFRDSKLTRILQSSLGGNARTAIICTMSPARVHVEQSRNTLLFASCAKEVTTNAQVNVVVSDKTLVKQLQKELARLENELRSTSAHDFSNMMKEKDAQIDKLNSKVEELTTQLGNARSELQSLLRATESQNPSPRRNNQELHYPKLRVRHFWGSDASYSTDSEGPHSVVIGVASPYQSHYSIGRNLPYTEVSVDSDGFADCNKEIPDDSSLDSYSIFCKEVQCVNVEETSRNLSATGPDLPDPDSKLLDHSPSCEYSPIPSDSTPEKFLEAENSPTTNLGSSVLTSATYDGDSHPEPPTCIGRKSQSSRRPPFPEKFSPFLHEDGSISARREKILRSRSCRARIMENCGECFLDAAENDEVCCSKMLPAVINENVLEISRDKFHTSEAKSACAVDEFVIVQKGTQEKGKEDEEEAASRWSLEFKNLRQEIIELWQKCNVSLVHRSYFFLLFKGDPSDSLYMEVEHRRLSFLEDIISRGSKTMVNGQLFSLTTSKRALSQERHMLTRQMSKVLKSEERENLFLKWGVPLGSTHRRLQLARQIWTQTADLDHAAESARLVAKLVDLKESDVALRELFGLLNFAPKQSAWRRNSLWRLP